jgi:hypothetical protein
MNRTFKVVAASLLTVAVAGSAAAAATVTPSYTMIVSKKSINVQGNYTINPDGFGEPMVLTNISRGPNFTVDTTTKYTGYVRAFPAIFIGCSWGICSPYRTLPAKVSTLMRLSRQKDPGASLSTAGNPGGTWNAAYDIWFDPHPIHNGQASGAEIMIWLRYPGTSHCRSTSIVKVDGARYCFVHWVTHHNGKHWNYVLFRKITRVYSLRGIHINDFIRVAEAHRFVNPSWYLLNITAGFEIWGGGKGLKVTNFWARG